MSTLKVTNIEHGSTTDGGIQLDNSGHVTIDGQQMPTAGPLSNRNLIINGAMNVAQRGTSSTANGYGSVDRWHIQWDGGTVTHTQTAITSGSPYDEGFRNVLRLTNTATGSGAGHYRNPFQYIEAQNLAQSGWNYTSSSSYVTLSFWVRSSVAQEFFGYLRTFDGTAQSYSFSTGTLSANTWTKVTKVIPGNSNITINNDAGVGLQLNIAAYWGGDFTSSGNTTDTWAAFSSGSRTPDFSNTWANTTDATFDITGVQLEVGEKATPFEHRSYGDELARCQRYFLRLAAGNMFHGRMNGGSNMDVSYFYPVTPRTVPTGSASLDTANAEYGSIGLTVNALSVNDTGSHAATIRAGLSSSGTSGHGAFLKITGDTTVDFSAEL